MVQTAIVLVLVLAALVFVARKVWSTLRPAAKAGCGSGCGCGESAAGTTGDWAKT